MVFKVKQRSQALYEDITVDQADRPNTSIKNLQNEKPAVADQSKDKNNYKAQFNWPYDYCSLVEAIKIDSKVGFRPDLDKEYEEVEAKLTQAVIDEKAGNK